MSDPIRYAYVNGDVVPESEARVSIRDLGFVYGDAVFDTARTFGGRIFRLEQHMDRLYESLKYARIDPGLSKAEMMAATESLLAKNLPALRDGEDYWVTQRISGGVKAPDGEPIPQEGATVVIECMPIPLRARAAMFRDGIEAQVAHRRRIAPEALSPNVKSNNYLNLMIAQKEVAALNPAAWALLMDPEGNIAEGAGCNFFIVKNGVVMTPTTEFVLNGVSRQVTLELCERLGIEARECAIPLQAAVTADEAFFTSTSLCICPTKSLNGLDYEAGAPGPVTSRLMDAFAEEAGYDYVAQYLRFLGNAPVRTGL